VTRDDRSERLISHLVESDEVQSNETWTHGGNCADRVFTDRRAFTSHTTCQSDRLATQEILLRNGLRRRVHIYLLDRTMRTSLTRSWESKWGQDVLSIANSDCIVESGVLFNCVAILRHDFLGTHCWESLENVGNLATKRRAARAVSGRMWSLLTVRVENAEEDGRLTGVIA
jgi:hypothetical protein